MPTSYRPSRSRLLAGSLMVALMMGITLSPPAIRAQEAPPPGSTAAILAASTPADWREPDPSNLLYLDFAATPAAAPGAPTHRVVIELAPQMAPATVANIRALVRAGWFNGLAVDRVQDDYVTQWGDADGRRAWPAGIPHTLAPEWTRAAAGLPFTALPDPDSYAPQAGFVDGFPAARDPLSGRAWLVHCYGMVGVGRDLAADSGNGGELYAVIGQAPRHLDRNITVVGRVLIGMPVLSALPRGTGPLGFYEQPGQRLPLVHAVLAADLPAAQRLPIAVLRTDTPTWAAYVEARRHRVESFFPVPADRVDVCNTPPPVRP